MNKYILGAALVATLATPAAAITITETVDFTSDISTPAFVGSLGLGSNTVTGSIDAECVSVGLRGFCNGFEGDDGDALSFSIGPGLQLSVATLTISDLSRGFASGGGSLVDPSAKLFGAGSRVLLGGGPVTGIQNFQLLPQLLGADVGNMVFFNWRLDLVTTEIAPVTPVPLPTSALLLLGGMGGLAALRRRKRLA